MPLISRMRLVNVRYDHATKIFTDDLFDLAGENSLFNLTNGGGKTVLLQLMLQVVLPREDLGRERKFDSFFEGPPVRSSHILVEWLLDSSEPKYLLTGLCATRGQDQEAGCRWFSYTREYKEEDVFRIDTIPLVDDARHPVSYTDLRRLLKNRTDSRLRIFGEDEKAAYGRHLEEFGIFPAEWEAIKRINLTEGGIEAFFNRCRTSRDCLEVLLIPNIEELLTKDEAMNRQQLSESFARHFNVLKCIPEWTRALREMGEFRQFAEGYISAVDKHADAAKGVMRQLARLNRLHERLVEREAAGERERTFISSDLERNAAESLDLEHRHESFHLYQRYLNINSLKFDEERLNALLNAAWEDVEKTKRLLLLSDAATFILNRDQARAICAAGRHELNELDSGDGQKDHLQQLYRCEYSLSGMYQKEIESLGNRLATAQAGIADAQRSLSSSEKERSNFLAGLSQTDRAIGESSGEKKTLEKNLSLLLEPFSIEDRLDPAAALKKVEDSDSALALQQHENASALERLDKEKQAVEAVESRLRTEEKNLNERGAELRRERVEFEAGLDAIRRNLRRFQIESFQPAVGTPEAGLGHEKDTYSAAPWSQETSAHLDRLLQERTAARRHAQIEALSLREQEALLRDRDWFPVNADIERLRDALRDHGLRVLSGGEYLASLDDEISRRRTLAGSPLLPYGLVVDSAELADPARLPLPDVSVRAGVPLIFRENLRESEPRSPGQTSEIGTGSAILEHTDRELFILPERRASYAADLERRLATANADAASFERAVDDLREIRRNLNEFTTKYPADSERKLASREMKFTADRQQLEKRQNELNARRATWSENVKSTGERRKALEVQRADLNGRRQSLKHCLDITGRLEILVDTARRTELRRLELEKALHQTETNIASATEAREHLTNSARELSEAGKTLKNRLGETRVPESWGEEWPESLTIACLEAIQTQLKDSLAGFERKREDVLSQIRQQEKLAQSWSDQLDRTGISEDEARSASPADDIQKNTWKELVRKRSQDEKTLQANVGVVKSQIDIKQGEYNESKQNLEKRFKRAPTPVFHADFDVVATEMALRRQSIDTKRTELSNRLSELNIRIDIFRSAKLKFDAFLDNQPTPRDIQKESIKIADEATPEGDVPDKDLLELIKHRCDACRNADRDRDEKKIAIDRLRRKLQETFGNSTVQALKNFVTTMQGGNDLDDPEAVRSVFGKCFEIIEKLHSDTVLQRTNAEKDQAELTRTCTNLVSRFLEEVRQIDSRSRIDLGDRSVKMIEVHIDEADGELRERRVREYVNRLVKELGETEFDPKQLRMEIEKRLIPARLLDAACDLDKARIKVRKPARPPNKPRTADWEEVPKFSGGEKFVCYFALYISLLTYIRAKKTASGHSNKVLLADNPFGRMSAEFLMDAMFTLARHTDTQMICFTALKETSILQHFPRLFSMVLRSNLDGREVMTTDPKTLSLETARLVLPRQPVLF